MHADLQTFANALPARLAASQPLNVDKALKAVSNHAIRTAARLIFGGQAEVVDAGSQQGRRNRLSFLGNDGAAFEFDRDRAAYVECAPKH